MLKEKVETAIERLRLADSMSRKYMDNEPLYVCISGGKDSSVIQQLAVESGLEVVFTHHHTTVDAPETVRFIRREFSRLSELGYKTQILYPKQSMWKLIEKHLGFPPTRIAQYCCKALKENGVRNSEGKPAFIVTGVRWAESTKRKQRNEFEALASDPSKAVRIAANDNDLSRRLFEDCRLRSERVCKPIIDWTDEDVWEFIRGRNIPYNPLYDEGFKRIGCIGCPFSTHQQKLDIFKRYPKYKKAYISAMDRGLEKRRLAGKDSPWKDGEEVFNWWISDSKKSSSN